MPYLEMEKPGVDNVKFMDEMPSPRMIKSHLPYQFLTRPLFEVKAKTIIVMRNPKDTMISFYHFYRINKNWGSFTGPWSEFFEMFMANKIVYGDWFDYTLGYWKLRDEPKICLVTYEEMKENIDIFCDICIA